MITLYQFPPAHDLPVSVSPYCANVELYLRLTGRAFETATGDVMKSPNRQLPYLRLADGSLLADSGAIIARLEAEGPALDEGLPEAERTAFAPLLEQIDRVLYHAVLYSRFGEAAGWARQKHVLRSMLPWFLAPILVPVVRASQVRRCRRNGVDGPDAYPAAAAVVREIEAALGTKDFFGDGQPRTVDCRLWGHLVQAASPLFPNPQQHAVASSPALSGYIRRMAERASIPL